MKKKSFIIKAAKVVTKLSEVCYWIVSVVMIVCAIFSLCNPGFMEDFWLVRAEADGAVGISICGFEMTLAAIDWVTPFATVLAFTAAIVFPALMAMIFHDLHLVIKRSENDTPFQPDNVRLLREIGIFAIAIPLLGFALSALARLALGVDAVETSVQIDGLSMGLVVLCLTQFFAHGLELENDVEGLV